MTIGQLKQLIDEGGSLELIAQTFTEIAQFNLSRIRQRVEQNRTFFSEISQVYKMVQLVAAKKQIGDITKNNRTIGILLTSNFRFYGELNIELIRFYINSFKGSIADTIIIGKTGIEFFNTYYPNKRYQTIIFKTDMPGEQELRDLASKINAYKRVLVFHTTFKSALSQIPTVTDITQVPLSQLKGIPKSFIFEPEIVKVLQFFKTQITTLLLEQTFLESELSRTAGRLISMNQAEKNAKDYIRDLNRKLLEAQRSITNISLLESFASFSAWKELQNEL